MSKVCGKCLHDKSTLDFHLDNFSQDGLARYCKDCFKVYADRAKWSPEGLAKIKWRGILARAANKNKRNPSYKNIMLGMSYDEYLAWAVPALRQFWNIYPGQRPHLDRIDNSKGYYVFNLQFLPPRQHRIKTLKEQLAKSEAGWYPQPQQSKKPLLY